MKNIVFELIDAIGLLIINMVDASSFIIKQESVDSLIFLWKYFGILATGLTLVYFLIEINNRLIFERSDFTLKSFFAPFLKLTIAVIVISQGAKILGWIVSCGNTFITKMDSDTSVGVFDLSAQTDALQDAWDKVAPHSMGFFLALSLLLPCLIALLVALCCSLVWLYKALVWKMEVLFRISFTPIALADVYSGKNSNAIRWLKSFLACVLTGGIYVVIPKVTYLIGLQDIVDKVENYYSSMGMSESWQMTCSIFMIMVVPIAALGLASVAKQALKEALS